MEQEEQREQRVIVTFAGGDTQILTFEAFTNLLLSQRSSNNRLFSCYLIREGDAVRGDALEIPKNIVKAMFASSIRDAEIDTLPDNEDDQSIDDGNIGGSTSGGVCSWLSDLGVSVFAGLKGILKVLGKVHKVAEVLEGAFGPSQTKQKVQKCLTRIGCILVVLSLVLFLTVAANGRFAHGKTFPKDRPTSTSWGAVALYGFSLTSIFAYGLHMVSKANEMSTTENYTEGDGQVAIVSALGPILFFILVVAFV